MKMVYCYDYDDNDNVDDEGCGGSDNHHDISSRL